MPSASTVVAVSVSSSAGTRYSRASDARWPAADPTSVTSAAARGSAAARPVPVVRATRTAPAGKPATSASVRTTATGPAATPLQATTPRSIRTRRPATRRGSAGGAGAAISCSGRDCRIQKLPAPSSAHSTSCGPPKRVSSAAPWRASSAAWASVRQGAPRSPGATASRRTPPAASRTSRVGFCAMRRSMIAPVARSTTMASAWTAPSTTVVPRPQTPLITMTSRSGSSGSRV